MQRVLHQPERLNKVFIFSIVISLVLHIAAVFYLERFFDFKPQISKIKTQNVKHFSFKKPEEGQILAIIFDQKEQLKMKAETEQQVPQLEKIQDAAVAVSSSKLKIQPKLEKIPDSNFSFSSKQKSSSIKTFLIKDLKQNKQYHFQVKLEDKADRKSVV